MNYRHAYHAGNFGDVLKHAVLALVIEHLKQKEAPFRIIDTHAGVGLYDLVSMEASKTGEWQDGIGRIWTESLPVPLRDILAPYLQAVAAENADGALRYYPGSPVIAARLMRRTDRLVLNELHPVDHAELAGRFARDARVKVLALDAWTALKSLLPPKERRAVVLIDPPFEEPGEFARLVSGLAEAHRRFASGVMLLWYPVKDVRALAGFHRELAALGLPRMLKAELFVRRANDPLRLSGTGLIILNPPYRLDEKLGVLLPFLARRLAQAEGWGSSLQWLSGERVTTA